MGRYGILLPLLVGGLFAGCGSGGGGYSQADLREARQAGFAAGQAAASRTSEDAVREARRTAYANGAAAGLRSALGGLDFQEGQNYIVDFASDADGLYVNGMLPMDLGVPYTCDTIKSCVSEGGGGALASGGGGSGSDDLDGDGCHDSYEGDCVLPDVPDVNCDEVLGPVYVVGPDEYGLDGYDNDGVGCE
jgi:hypothetical protein